MNAEKLNQHLFSSVTRVYAVLDGASVPKLPVKLYEMKPPNFCLLTGDLKPDMAEVAPYLIRLEQKSPFTVWLLQEFWGKHWGIFVHSRRTIAEMRKQFHSLITVYDESGNPLLFRFYDPRVLPEFLKTCNEAELKTFFGKADSLFAENGQGLLSFKLENNELKQTTLE